MKVLKLFGMVVVAASLVACGGGGGSSSPTVSTGYFLDSAVGGVSYQTATQSGITGADGSFSYIAGETVTFSVGSIAMPVVAAGAKITPFDLAGSSDLNNNKVVNLLVFLQSIDKDGNPGNGITVEPTTASSATNALNFNLSTADFRNQQALVDVVVAARGAGISPVSTAVATTHFKSTITANGIVAAPVANAGADQSVVAGDAVTLDGTGSSDANNDVLTYRWNVTSKPNGSSAALSSTSASKPTFTADVAGVYVFGLTVSDGAFTSSSDSISVVAGVANAAPVANAGADQNVVAGDTVTLDGTGSSDANGDSLTYAWSIISKPSGSTATLTDAAASKPTFIADIAGAYEVSLSVSDGALTSATSNVTVTTDCDTTLTGILNVNTTYPAGNYCIGDFQVRDGVTATFEAGGFIFPIYNSTDMNPVSGASGAITVQGNVIINGTAQNKVHVSNINFIPAGLNNNIGLSLSIQYASIYGGKIFHPTGNGFTGNLNITNSRIENLGGYIYLVYPSGTSTIEKNIFVNSGGITYAVSKGDRFNSLSISNNYFANWTTSYAIQNYADYNTNGVTIEKNSFILETVGNKYAAYLPNGYTSTLLYMPNNYWGTTDTAIIDAMIYDNNDDLRSGNSVTYLPILTSPDSQTPTP